MVSMHGIYYYDLFFSIPLGYLQTIFELDSSKLVCLESSINPFFFGNALLSDSKPFVLQPPAATFVSEAVSTIV